MRRSSLLLSLLPDLKTFWAIEILNYDYDTLAKEKDLDRKNKKDWKYITVLLICCLFIFMIGFKMR